MWKLLFFVFVVIGLGASSACTSPDLYNEKYPTRAESDFAFFWKNIETEFKSTHLEHIRRNFKIIFVPGLLADIPVALEKHSLAEYFRDQMDWLEDQGFERGIDFLRMDRYLESTRLGSYEFEWDSEAPARDNGYILADEILNSDRKVLLITHSKGGIDTLNAMMNVLAVPTDDDDEDAGNRFHWRQRDVWKNVGGWFSIQTPFWGSPIADLAIGSPLLRRASLKILRDWLEGSPKALVDLRRKRRESYYEKHDGDLKQMAEEFPFFMMSTMASKSILEVSLILSLTHSVMHVGMGIENDGLVPLDSGYMKDIPAAEILRFKGIDHGAPVMSDWMGRYTKEDRVRFMKTIFALVLSRAS